MLPGRTKLFGRGRLQFFLAVVVMATTRFFGMGVKINGANFAEIDHPSCPPKRSRVCVYRVITCGCFVFFGKIGVDERCGRTGEYLAVDRKPETGWIKGACGDSGQIRCHAKPPQYIRAAIGAKPGGKAAARFRGESVVFRHAGHVDVRLVEIG